MTMTARKLDDEHPLTARIQSRRVEIERIKALLAQLFEEQHRDFLKMYRDGVPKLRIAKLGGTDKTQVHKAIHNLMAEDGDD